MIGISTAVDHARCIIVDEARRSPYPINVPAGLRQSLWAFRDLMTWIRGIDEPRAYSIGDIGELAHFTANRYPTLMNRGLLIICPRSIYIDQYHPVLCLGGGVMAYGMAILTMMCSTGFADIPDQYMEEAMRFMESRMIGFR